MRLIVNVALIARSSPLSTSLRQPLVSIVPKLCLLELVVIRVLGTIVNLDIKISSNPRPEDIPGTYRIPQLESQIQISREAFAMLEPFLALQLNLLPSLGRGGVRLQRKIIQIGPDSDTQTAVIIVNEGKPIKELDESRT